jgi:hypothetical protein
MNEGDREMLIQHCSDHLNKHIRNILATCHCCDHSIRANFGTKRILAIRLRSQRTVSLYLLPKIRCTEYNDDIPHSSHTALGDRIVIYDSIEMSRTIGPITVFVSYRSTQQTFNSFLKVGILSSGTCRQVVW